MSAHDKNTVDWIYSLDRERQMLLMDKEQIGFSFNFTLTANFGHDLTS